MLDICAIAGIFCGVASIGVDFMADHAAECTAKGQCLKLKELYLPFCIGGSDCCSE